MTSYYKDGIMLVTQQVTCGAKGGGDYGKCELELRPYSYTLVGVDSKYDLMKTDFGEYGEQNRAWTADDVKGFTTIMGNPMKIYYNVTNRAENKEK